MVGQFAAGYGTVSRRLLHIFCCSGDCGANPRAWRALRSIGDNFEVQDETTDATLVASTEPGFVGDDWGVAAPVGASDDWGVDPVGSNDDWGVEKVDDWGAYPAGAASMPVVKDDELAALLAARDGSSSSTDARAKPAKKISAARADTASAAAVAGDELWLGVRGDPGPKETEGDGKGSVGSSKGGESISFGPCLALEIYEEPYASAETSGDHVQELLDRYLKSEFAAEEGGRQALEGEEDTSVPAEFADELKAERARMKADVVPDDLGSDEDEDEDPADIWMMKFQKRIDRSPTQVVRYCWGGEAFWIAPPAKGFPGSSARGAAGSSVPRCGLCGAERIFELQLLPTLPSQIKAACPAQATELKIEWGTVAIYTCSEDCVNNDPCEEFVLVQPAV